MLRSEAPNCNKRHAVRRFSRPGSGAYLSHLDIVAMAGHGENRIVTNAFTGDDITSSFRPIPIER